MRQPSNIHNWSGYPCVEAQVFSFRSIPELRSFVKSTPKFIARGAGLSYGDASLAPVILSTLHFNKILAFDREKGLLRCESGITLDEVLKVIVPSGWFLPVTPGTKFITLGGAVAADVHGKNHHKEGAISDYVTQLSLMQSNGDIVNCSREENEDIFHSTCGGMGLSGVILDVEIRLKKIDTSYILQHNLIAHNFNHLVELIEEHSNATYSVAWIDCIASGDKMGQGVLMLGEHAMEDELPLRLRKQKLSVHKKPWLTAPFYLPSFALNPFSIRIFNSLFFLKYKVTPKKSAAHYDAFFYPLDFILHWNRMYGKRGFLQYQFVIPMEDGQYIMSEILKRIAKSKLASFLSVLKLLGKTDHPISFPMQGFTLALDFPITDKLFPLLDELDSIVINNGGRLYLAKDARMKRETFEMGYPEASVFRQTIKELNRDPKFESLMSKRLSIVK